MIYRTLDEALEKVWKTMNRFNAGRLYYFAVNDKVTTRIVKVCDPKGAWLEAGTVLPYEHSYCSLIVSNNMDTLIIRDVNSDPLTVAHPFTSSLAHRSFIGAAILQGDGSVYGTLGVLDSNADAFDGRDAALLESMSMLISYAVDADRLLGEWSAAQIKMMSAEANAEKANAEKSLYLRLISHGIRTPLNGVIGMTSLLQDTELSGEQVDYARIVQLSGELIVTFTKDVVDLAEIESGIMVLDHLPLDLHACVEDVMNRFAGEAAGNGVSLEGKVSPLIPRTLFGDQARISQILVNAVGNALKFTTGGNILLQIEPGEHSDEQEMELLIIMKGTHTHIPSEKIALLLYNFPTSKLSHKSTDQATLGLELVISRRLVEMMGGRIWTEISDELGTALYFSLRIAFS
ncbi:ATP-binding protein [Paenibacillus nasutitermitis]|uniref:histidine kinase n=1 Tax=Paenibacillus nasutitermitis TaxID=1652958 RepID=A0A917DXJ4_9BACL|nr:ATP-binding protein [Paenibacillus nasutitermitis]GGD77094.1 hypothetical protein GCM10010911_38930 [Paenibacillus nasutitermitis]